MIALAPHDDLFSTKQREPSSPPKEKAFNGPEYLPPRDFDRLKSQLEKVFDLMIDGKWRTLARIAEATNSPHASVSAQLRHLRKPKYGAYIVERRHIAHGLFEYRVLRAPE